MKYTTFKDMNGLEVTVQYSGSGDKGLLLNKKQAKTLVRAINDLLEDEE
jgi:methylaspartate ammonia-lyase